MKARNPHISVSLITEASAKAIKLEEHGMAKRIHLSKEVTALVSDVFQCVSCVTLLLVVNALPLMYFLICIFFFDSAQGPGCHSRHFVCV